MIWNQHLLYQIIDVWYHIRKLYLINNEKNDKIKLNHFFYKRRPIDISTNTFNKKAFWPSDAKRYKDITTKFNVKKLPCIVILVYSFYDATTPV